MTQPRPRRSGVSGPILTVMGKERRQVGREVDWALGEALLLGLIATGGLLLILLGIGHSACRADASLWAQLGCLIRFTWTALGGA